MLKKIFFTGLLFIFLFNINVKAQSPDPWIIQAYKEMYGRQPSAWELNINNYNLGSWNNYNELKKYIVEYHSSLRNDGYNAKTILLDKNQSATIFYQNGAAVAGALISNKAGSILGENGLGLISVDHARLIGMDHASLQKLAAVSFADVSTKFTQAAGIKYLKASGRGRLIMKKR